MIAIDVELLTRRYVATSFEDRSAPEWPPHPARLFSALVATMSEHDDLTDRGRLALEWLERQGAPHVCASEAESRSVVTTYVPGNSNRVLGDWSRAEAALEEAEAALEKIEQGGEDRTLRRARTAVDRARARLDKQIAKAVAEEREPKATACATARGMLPEHRGRQPRFLPSVTPIEPRVRFLWPAADPDELTHETLSQLAQRMVRLGHSSTLVACRVVRLDAERDKAAAMHIWTPGRAGTKRLRSVLPGQLSHLERAYARHRGVDPRVLPAAHQPYQRSGGATEAEPARSVFREWLILREIAPRSGRRMGLRLTRTEDVTRALRSALIEHAEDPPAALSGRGPSGRPLTAPHAAFVTLADVASPHATGAILGVALLLPQGLDPVDRQAILRALGSWERAGLRLELGRGGALELERVVDVDPRQSLNPASWSGPSRRWASVTPIALDQNPGDLAASDPSIAALAAERAEQIVSRSCEHIGLPRPAWVQVMPRSLFGAAPAARRFMPYPRNGPGNRRVCVHVELRFNERVHGPALLGAGRYFGLGLCRPPREQ